MVARIMNKLFAIISMLLSWNVMQPEELTPGDHIYTYRRYGLYTHHGIYIGDGYVIHLTRTGAEKTSLDSFRQEGEKFHTLHLYAYGRPMPEYMLTWLTTRGTRTTIPITRSPKEVISKAWELYEGDGFGEYNLWNNNCEHFTTFCQTGVRASSQTDLIKWLGAEGQRSQKDWATGIMQRMKLISTSN